MDIPCMRRGNDRTPFRWWEWLLYPIMLPLFVLLLLGMLIASIPYEVLRRRRARDDRKSLRVRMMGEGRFVEWPEIERHLMSGEGTLVVEHRSPKGPVLEWWTSDDLIAEAPVSLPQSIKRLPSESSLESLFAYARSCASRYVDVEAGRAKLTEVPGAAPAPLSPKGEFVIVNLGGGVMTAIALKTGRHLKDAYPRAKIVTLIRWSDSPLLVVGDAEDAFLSKAESESSREVA